MLSGSELHVQLQVKVSVHTWVAQADNLFKGAFVEGRMPGPRQYSSMFPYRVWRTQTCYTI